MTNKSVYDSKVSFGLGRVDKLNLDSDAAKQNEGGAALDQPVIAGSEPDVSSSHD